MTPSELTGRHNGVAGRLQVRGRVRGRQDARPRSGSVSACSATTQRVRGRPCVGLWQSHATEPLSPACVRVIARARWRARALDQASTPGPTAVGTRASSWRGSATAAVRFPEPGQISRTLSYTSTTPGCISKCSDRASEIESWHDQASRIESLVVATVRRSPTRILLCWGVCQIRDRSANVFWSGRPITNRAGSDQASCGGAGAPSTGASSSVAQPTAAVGHRGAARQSASQTASQGLLYGWA